MMLVYNVTINLDEEIAQEWLEWMRNEHIPDLMNTGCFTAYRLARLLDLPDTPGLSFSVQYVCPSRADYDRYLADYAQTMRNRGIERFGNRFHAFRTLMEVLHEGRT